MLRKVLLAVALTATFGMIGGVAFATPPVEPGPESNNWYVCKYVGAPGASEVVQTGQNPIFVDENAIDPGADGVVNVGDAFSDAQGGSLVIAGPYAPNDKPEEEPTADDCPTGETTPPPNPCDNQEVVDQDECPTTPPPTTTTPPPPTICDFSVTAGPWYGDPRINITLSGSGSFVVRGGIQRFTNTRVVRVTLECGETFKVSRYKVHGGKTASVYRNGVLVASFTAPTLS